MRYSFIFTILFYSGTAFGSVELGGRFGLDRKVYGVQRDNKINSETYSGFISLYFFSTTALEFSLSRTKDLTVEKEDVTVDTNLILDELTRKVETEVRTVGLKQLLVPAKWRVQPLIAIGYAKQIVKSETEYKFISNGTEITSVNTDPKQEFDSTFASFILKIYLGKKISLSGSVKTIFQDSDYDNARNNIKYLVGLSIRL
jgi:hypothetical protein